MRTAVDELKYRLEFVEENAGKEPADFLPNHKKAFICQTDAWNFYSIYIYKVALKSENGAQKALHRACEMSKLASKYYPQNNIKNLEPLFLAKILLKEDVTDVSRRIIEAARTNTNEYASPLIAVIASLWLEHEHSMFMDWFRKWETKKYTSVLPGSAEAINHLIDRNETSLVSTLNSILLAHHKEANNRHSGIYNTYNSFLSLSPLLIIELATFIGLDVKSRISENKHSLKLGLLFPSESPELPKNFKMPIEVDYLSAKTNL